MLNRFQRFIRATGFVLMSNSLLFTQITASAQSSSSGSPSVGVGVVGAIVGGGLTAFILVSKSRTKHHASEASQYKAEELTLDAKEDVYLRKEVTSYTIDDDKE